MEWLLSLGNTPVGILGAIIAAVVVYFTGKYSGKAASDREYQRKQAEDAVKEARDSIQSINESINTANEIRETIRNLPDGGAAERLRREFTKGRKNP